MLNTYHGRTKILPKRKPPFKRGDLVAHCNELYRGDFFKGDVKELFKAKLLFRVLSIHPLNSQTAYPEMRNTPSDSSWRMSIYRIDMTEADAIEMNFNRDYPHYTKLSEKQIHDIRGLITSVKFGF